LAVDNNKKKSVIPTRGPTSKITTSVAFLLLAAAAPVTT
jgi:hypothetical protein